MTDAILTSTTPAAFFEEELHDVASAARDLGLKPVRAWVADAKGKAGTAGAERTRRCRERAEQLGLKQLSITLPVELHPMLRTFAERTKAGEPAEKVLTELLGDQPAPFGETPPAQAGRSAVTLESLPAWRRWLLQWLLPSGTH